VDYLGKLFAAHETGSSFLSETVVGQFQVNARAVMGSCRSVAIVLMAGDDNADDMEHGLSFEQTPAAQRLVVAVSIF
jgi:hypothetical protein